MKLSNAAYSMNNVINFRTSLFREELIPLTCAEGGHWGSFREVR